MEPVLELPAAQMNLVVKALTYINDVRRRRRFSVLVEESAAADWLDSAPETTADLIFYTKDELHILDSKFGKIPVEVVENKQLLYYAATFAYLAPRAKEVHLHIVQPACDNMDEWVVSTQELAAFMSAARATEKLIMAKDTTFQPGDSCTFCPANPHGRGDKGAPLCPAMMQMLYPSVLDEDEILAG
jgi:hypothetical protein